MTVLPNLQDPQDVTRWAADLVSAVEQRLRVLEQTAIKRQSTQEFRAVEPGTAAIELVANDDGPTPGPILSLYRNSASPETNDLLGRIDFIGNHPSTGERHTYAQINGTSHDATSDDGQLDFVIRIAGALVNALRIDDAAGIPRAGAYWEKAGPDEGPYLTARRRQANPQANDKIGALVFDGSNAGGENSTINYAKVVCRILDPTIDSEDAQLEMSVIAGGEITGVLSLRADRDLTLLRHGTRLTGGEGDPEGVISAPVGSIYMRKDGGANTSVYFKESGAGSTGWVGK